MSTNSFWDTVQWCTNLSPLNFYVWGNLKTLVYVALIENEETLHQHIFDACQAIENCPRTFWKCVSPWSDISMHALVQVEEVWAFIVICHLINIKNSVVIKLGMCEMYCHL
jgi:hypothetical protein